MSLSSRVKDYSPVTFCGDIDTVRLEKKMTSSYGVTYNEVCDLALVW